MSRPPISVLLPTYNCAATVRATLESVTWADEILVVDSYSTDGTLDICREYGARIVQHEYINSAKQKNWALPQSRHEWVLQIDSDEVVTPELRAEIERAVATAAADVQAFRMPRRNLVLGRWVRHGGVYPDYQTRLMRRNSARWQEREVHAHVTVAGKTQTLRHDLIHSDILRLCKPLGNLDRYTRYEADELKKNGQRFRWHHLLLRPGGAFLYRYLWLQGFRDGWRGLIVCAYWAVYVFFTRAKLWEIEELGLEHSPRSGSGAAPDPRKAGPASQLFGSPTGVTRDAAHLGP
jgi:glycosyltransferase involved in cell wall biosynthesis